MVSRDTSFEVGDHNFTRFSIVPSVTFVIDVPEEIECSWNSGNVLVGLKEAGFEPLPPESHSTELCDILTTRNLDANPMLLLYCDGGPDHRLTYLSVQLSTSMISLFLKLDLDFLCACCTAPFNSWRNLVERMMLILNLGFQSVDQVMKHEEI